MFVLSHDDRIPLYTQLYLLIKNNILSGNLLANTRLPSVRDFAAEISVSRNTIESAYLELYSEGYVYSKPRSGYFIAEIADDNVLSALSYERRLIAPSTAAQLRCHFDFHPARLDPEAFPARLWRKCFLDCLRRSSRELVQYNEPQGEWGLRAHIQKYVERSRGVICGPEQIVICSGLQHSLDIVAHLQKDRRPVVAVENPGYHIPRAVFRNHSFEQIPIAVESNGIDLDLLETSGSTIVYVTPSHQFPLGGVMPAAKRLKLIEWAKSGGKLIIEDDYDSELRYHGKPIPSLQGLHPNGDIIYLGTFSKMLSPALRISYMILPHSLLPTYRRLFKDYASSVSLLEQGTLTQFMEQGHWERHVRRMRILYRKKHDTLLQAVERHFGSNAVILGSGAGLHVVLQLAAQRLGEVEMIELAKSKGIGLFPFSETYATDETDSSKFLLGFGGMTTNEIEEGIALLSSIWCN